MSRSSRVSPVFPEYAQRYMGYFNNDLLGEPENVPQSRVTWENWNNMKILRVIKSINQVFEHQEGRHNANKRQLITKYR